MSTSRPKILLACDRRIRFEYLPPDELKRLESFADWAWFPCEGGDIYGVNEDQETATELAQHVSEIDGLVVCRGAPAITPAIMGRAPSLRIIGEMEGDRFAGRIELEAAWKRQIRVVDTSNGSSYPTAEWALALILIALRRAGAQFRRMIAGKTAPPEKTARKQMGGTLTAKRVGLIGCGHMGRRLIKLLQPFEVDIWVYDPYLPEEFAEALGFTATSLDNLLSQCGVIVCLVPLTPSTRGMLGKRELDLIASGAVLVNVSRGPVINSEALIERLRRGDISAGLDVFDPEPIPPCE